MKETSDASTINDAAVRHLWPGKSAAQIWTRRPD
jgi:hypothetical protein